MNDIPSSDQPGGQPSGQPAGTPGGAPFGSGFFAWIRGLGIVRGNDRWFAGVAGGIAARAGIDPLIVRGIFIVLAVLGGPGILLYLLGWLLLPDFTGRIHVEDIFRGRAHAGVVTAAIVFATLVLIPAFFSIFSPGASPFSVWGWGVWGAIGIPEWLRGTLAWLCWIAIIVGGAFWLRAVLLRRGRSAAEREAAAGAAGAAAGSAAGAAAAEAAGAAQAAADAAAGAASAAGDAARGAANAAGAAGSAAAADFTAQARAFADRTEQAAQRASESASEWGQRASAQATRWSEEVGRQADEWSARYAEHHDAHRMGVAQSVITLALALLAGGLSAAWALTVLSVSPTTAMIGGLTVAVAVLAVSIIIAGIRGRHTGWIGFLATCGVAALLLTVVLPWGTRFQPFGTMHVAGTEAPGTVLIAGTSQIDLTSLDDREPRAETLEVWQLAGNAEIELPDHAPVVVQVRLLAGAVTELGDEPRSSGGPFLLRNISANLPPRGSDAYDAAAAEATVVTVTMLAGRVEVDGVREASAERAPRANEQSGSAGSERDQANADERSRLEAEDRERTRIESEIDRIDWKLSEPGLSDRAARELESSREALIDALDGLTTEVAR